MTDWSLSRNTDRAGEGLMSPENLVTEGTLQRLSDVRHSLLRLHKVLLEYQRRDYERFSGRIDNSYHFLKLVMRDKAFAWLHRLSELVVQIDEMLDAEQGPVETDAIVLLDQARFLLTPSESGDEFQKKYFDSLQDSPDVVLAHSEVVKLLGKKSSEVH